MAWNDYWSSLSRVSFFYKLTQKNQARMYKKLLDPLKLNSPTILEIGAGTGLLSRELIKKYGGEATLVDSSEEAYKLFLRINKHKNKMSYIVDDVFKTRINEKYNIVFSDGLIEHFKNEKQIELMNIHKKLSKQFVIFLVPTPNTFYKTTRKFLEKTNQWYFGYEKPMLMPELKALCEKINLEIINEVEGAWEIGVLCKVK